MEITIDDVRQLAFELYMSQREVALLRAANVELRRLLEQKGVAYADSSRPDPDPGYSSAGHGNNSAA